MIKPAFKILTRQPLTKDTKYRKVRKELKGLTTSQIKTYIILHSEPDRIFTIKELTKIISLSRWQITNILNKLEDLNLLPNWVFRRRTKMKLKLLKRTPEQTQIAKETARKAIKDKADGN